MKGEQGEDIIRLSKNVQAVELQSTRNPWAMAAMTGKEKNIPRVLTDK
jgi:hypothetical protein